MGEGGPAAELHVIEQPNLAIARQGAGGVHHVAFRTPDAEQYHAWAQRLNEFGIPNSGEIDRFYFRSLYFREPNGILFEIATDGPGFATDEPMEKLGEKLALPPFLETRRAEIEAGLSRWVERKKRSKASSRGKPNLKIQQPLQMLGGLPSLSLPRSRSLFRRVSVAFPA